MGQQIVPMIHDCPVFDLQPLGGSYYEVSVDGEHAILMGAGAVVKGTVRIPDPYDIYHVHCRSRFARASIEIQMLHDELRRRFVYTGTVAEAVSVLIHNKGQDLVLFREGAIAVAVADYWQISRRRSTTPHAVVCPEARSERGLMFLSIGNQRLQIVEERLPLFPLSPTRKVRYIDPLADDLYSCTESVGFVKKHATIIIRYGQIVYHRHRRGKRSWEGALY